MRSLGRGILFGCGAMLSLVIVVIIIAVLAFGGSGGSSGGGSENEVITIRVTGTDGTSFSGNYGGLEGSQSVDGTIPTDYKVKTDTTFTSTDTLAVVMQKNIAPGTLNVQILRGGNVVAEKSTTAAYGAVDLSWTPNAQ